MELPNFWQFITIAFIIIIFSIFGTGWMWYNKKLHLLFLFIYLGVMTIGAGYDNSGFVNALTILIAIHYTLHWVLKQGAIYGKKIPYPTTHRDLRDIHSAYEESPGE